jgi:cell division protein ZipA
MGELRWILLLAGLGLIAGVYLWGTRGQRKSPGDGAKLQARTENPAPAQAAAKRARTEPLVSLGEHEEPAAERAGDGLTNSDPYEGLDEPAIERRATAAGSRLERKAPSVDTADPYEHLDEPAIERRDPAAAVRVERKVPSIEPAPPLKPTPPAAMPSPAKEPESGSAETPNVHRTGVAEADKKPPKQKIVALRVIAPMPEAFDGAMLRDALHRLGFRLGRYDIFHWMNEQGRPVFSLASLLEPGTFDLDTMPEATYPGVALFAVFPGPMPAAETFEEMLRAARYLARELNGSLHDERGAPLGERGLENLRQSMATLEQDLRGGPKPG